jgi:hypothetical protein
LPFVGVRAALAALLALLALPRAATAQSFSVPARLPPLAYPELSGVGADGPALAGDQVLWFERRGGAAVLVAARAGEVRRDVLVLPPRIGTAFLSIAAAGSTAIAQRIVTRGDRVVGGERLRVDLATGEVAPFDACLGDPECRACTATARSPST